VRGIAVGSVLQAWCRRITGRDRPFVDIYEAGAGRRGRFWAALAMASLAIWLGADPAPAAQTEQVAFPGAEGYGQMSQGGRGGAILFVDNLDDAGAGSLRACVEAQGPRNCVFRVGGIIHLKEQLIVLEPNSYLSILGQTAPGGGILISIDQVDAKRSNFTPLVVKNAHDVIIRHVRLRPQLPNWVKNVDALTVESSQRVYVDHVSGSWATDENFNSHANTTDLTVSHSLFGEGLNKHSKCALLGSDPRIPQKITFWKNACVSNRDRNPDDNHYGGSCIDIVNNVFFNARSEWGEVFSQYPGGTPISFVGNFFKAGPSTEDTTYAINWNDTATVAGPQIYQVDNQIWSPKDKNVVLIAPDTEQYLVAKPPCPLSVSTIEPARDAYDNVRRTAGAFPRDAFDRGLMRDMGAIDEHGKGQMIRAPRDLPSIEGGTAYADKDGDGMADAMEAAIGAKPGVSDAWEDSDGDGWANFDQFMAQLEKDRLVGKYPQ
jgi:pectate lyase